MTKVTFTGEKKFHPFRFLEIFLYRVSRKIARRHVRHYPQMAVFSFDHIGLTINLEGRFEGEDLEILRGFLTGVLKTDTTAAALDIGANIGNHARFFSDIFPKVIAFEPNPRTFKLLEFNSHDTAITPVNLGLSSEDATLDFLVLPTNVGGSCIVTDAPGAGADNLIRVDVRRLDGMAEIQDLDIALVKIDVEGHELAVLEGAEATLSRTRPVIVFEQLAREIRDGTSGVITHLRARDYTFFTIEQNFRLGKSKPARALAFALRSLTGFQKTVVATDRFEPMNHDMIIAVPSERL